MIKLDTTDIRILEMLQLDSQKTIKEMANQLNLSTTPVFERIKKLEQNQIIKKYVAILDAVKLGIKLSAFVNISIKDHSTKAVEDFVGQIISYEEVMECHHVTGDSDFLLKIMVSDIEEYNQFILQKLSTVPNVGKVTSSFSLSIRKDTNRLALNKCEV